MLSLVPHSVKCPSGTYILAKVDGKRELLMSGTGASPEGNRPFLDLFDLDTKEARRLWQSSPPYLESVGAIMSDFNHVSWLLLPCFLQLHPCCTQLKGC